MICRQSESCADQARALRLSPMDDVPFLARVRANGTLRIEFMQEAWGRASGLVIVIIIATCNHRSSISPNSICEQAAGLDARPTAPGSRRGRGDRSLYCTRNVANIVGCNVQAYANTPAFLAVYFQDPPAAISWESNCFPTAVAVCGNGS